MLQSIHDKAKGWIAYVIVGFISIPFVFWGINEYLGGGEKLLVAQVNGEDISLDSYKRSLQLQRDRMREMFGGNLPPGMLDGAVIKQTVVDGMVRDELLRQFAEEENFQVSNEQLAEEIRSLPVFQENGSFSSEKYTQLLASRRMDKVAFEQDLRYGLRLQQFSEAVRTSDFLTQSELENFGSLNAQTREIELATYALGEVQKDLSVNDEEIEAYYSSHQNEFLSEERVKVSYLVLDPATVVEATQVSDEAVRSFYDQEQDRFKTPEARSVSHILIKKGEGASDDDPKVKSDEIAQRLEAGESFEELAREFSEDVLSSESGGELGLIYPGDMDPEVEKVIFSLPLSQSSEAVETAQGIQFLLVKEIQDSEQQSFEEVRDVAALELKQREADSKLLGLSEQLLTLTYENPESLDIAADALGFDVQTTGWVTRNSADGVLAESRVKEAVFSEAVLQSGQNSDLLDLEDGRQVVVRVAEHEPASTLALGDVEDRILALVLDAKGRKEALLRAEGLAKEAVGTGLKAVSSAKGADVLYAEPLTIQRRGSEVPEEIVSRVFKMAHPKGSGVIETLQLGNGDAVVVQLNKVDSPADLDAANDQARTVLAEANGQRSFDAVYRFMESKAEIVIFAENFLDER